MRVFREAVRSFEFKCREPKASSALPPSVLTFRCVPHWLASVIRLVLKPVYRLRIQFLRVAVEYLQVTCFAFGSTAFFLSCTNSELGVSLQLDFQGEPLEWGVCNVRPIQGSSNSWL